MGKTVIKIERNPHNGGFCCNFEKDGQKYFADLCYIPYSFDTECMIFKVEKDYQVTLANAKELYCERSIPVTAEQLTKCVEQFLKSL